MGFGIILKELRKEKSVTQKMLSDVLGYSRSAIAAYESERNEPVFSDLIRIAEYFNVSTDYLLGHDSSSSRVGKIQLSDHEEKLITRYRALSTEDKIRIDERIDTLFEENSSSIYRNTQKHSG